MQRMFHCSVRASFNHVKIPLQVLQLPNSKLLQYRTFVAFGHDDKSAQSSGTTTGGPEGATSEAQVDDATVSPFRFITGHALFAKRPSRPFPPPFLSVPSSSFSDPLSTHDRSVDKRREARYQGQRIRGVTNGDDAVLAEPHMLAVGDGVGAWAQKERGHAAYVTLWKIRSDEYN